MTAAVRAWLSRNLDFAIFVLVLGLIVFVLVFFLLKSALPLSRGGV